MVFLNFLFFRVFVLFVFLIGAIEVGACAWVSGTTVDGVYSHELGGRSGVDGLMGAYEDGVRDRFARVFDVEVGALSAEDAAMRLVLEGEYEKGIADLLEIENGEGKKRYTVASNLGTAYELSGDFVNARKWIAEGIKRDEESHYGSEWLHLFILDSKLGVVKERFSDLMVNVEGEEWYQVTFEGKKYEMHELRRALIYQLNERMVFVKGDSPIVADLLLSLSMIVAERSGLERAVKLLELAEKYGDVDQVKFLRERRAGYEEKIAGVWWFAKLPLMFQVTGVIFGLYVLVKLGLWWRKRG